LAARVVTVAGTLLEPSLPPQHDRLRLLGGRLGRDRGTGCSLDDRLVGRLILAGRLGRNGLGFGS
ncbi:hypothetical protein AB4144_61440, partial [Rhizobiaceae sp. 2RAB30]